MGNEDTSGEDQARDGGGVLVVRVWRDPRGAAFRARLTTDAGTGAMLGSPDEVLRAIRRWLADHAGPEASLDRRHTRR